MKIKELFSSEDKWIKGGLARDKDGEALSDIKLEKGYSFCLIGALYHCYEAPELFSIHTKIKNYIINLKLGYDTKGLVISEYNNDPSTKFEDIVKLVNDLDI